MISKLYSLRLIILSLLFLNLFLWSCDDDDQTFVFADPPGMESDTLRCDSLTFDYQMQEGCDGQTYPNPDSTNYIIPFPAGTEFSIGLANCSNSYHGAGQPDQYAFDFDLGEGTPFLASRMGEVVKVVESESSAGGGAGNYVVIDHEDNTFGLYYHSPQNGIYVEEGDMVTQGQELGEVGKSGLAGYPHLHFIVVRDSFNYPYTAMPVSFSNVSPPHVILASFSDYEVCY